MAKILICTSLLLGACSTIADEETLTGSPQAEYSAVGQNPRWALRIDHDRVAFIDGVTNIRTTAALTPAVPTAAGRRYATSRVVVDIVSGACRDAVGGSGFDDMVTVTTGGRAFTGCGGPRLVERGAY